MLMHCCGFFNHLVNLSPHFSVSSWLFGAGAGNRGFIPARWLRAAAASGAGKPASAVFTNRWCLLRLDHLTLMMLWCFELAPTHHVVVNTILSSLPLAEKKQLLDSAAGDIEHCKPEDVIQGCDAERCSLKCREKMFYRSDCGDLGTVETGLLGRGMLGAAAQGGGMMSCSAHPSRPLTRHRICSIAEGGN